MILLFGSNGQLGREFAGACGGHRISLIALSHAQAGISDRGAVCQAVARHTPRLVVNAASFTKVDLAETETELAFQANERGPAIIAEACAAAGIPLVHVSTDYVFDGAKSGAYVEDDPIAPINSYGLSKAAGERAVRAATQRHIILRTSWVYSEFGQNFLKTMLRLAATRDELRIVADQRGCPTSARDLAAAILAIAPRIIAGEDVCGTYHFAGAGVTTWHGFASRIVAAQAPLTGRVPRITAITTAEFPTPARRPANSELDCSLFERTFGFHGRPWTEETDAITTAIVNAELGIPLHVS
jgi:dTDP-4-dehydrorhamnose reductase